MATNVYTTVAIVSYNASPPADDGSQTSANRVTWSGQKTKLADPVKTLAETINTNVNTAFGALVLTDNAGEDNVVLHMRVFG